MLAVIECEGQIELVWLFDCVIAQPSYIREVACFDSRFGGHVLLMFVLTVGNVVLAYSWSSPLCTVSPIGYLYDESFVIMAYWSSVFVFHYVCD